MLPAAHRITDAASFREVTRRGRRATSASLVVHVWATSPAAPARAGFVVSKAVGNSVVRNRVKRRLRHLAAARLPGLSEGSLVVVRALPAAATRSSVGLARDLDACLSRATPAGAAR